MRTSGTAGAKILAVALLVTVAVSAFAGEVVLTSESWESTDPAFEEFSQRIRELHGRNLLARRNVRIASDGSASVPGPRMLVDGLAGERGGEGRVFVNGQPSTVTFYLGEPKTIKEVGVFTFNVDTRANQDFEVRFFDNSRKPGERPAFRDPPELTSGDTILGADRGGFHTRFIDAQGGPLLPGKVDWVQFKIWRTYPVQAGQPAKSTTPNGASAYIELEVLGEEHDVIVPTPEEIARREAIRTAPKKPEYVRKDTWQATLIASREAILEWECMQDKLALPDSPAGFGPWYVLGPLSARSEEVAQIRKESRIDLEKRYPGKDGTEIGWEVREGLEDGKINDLTDYRGAEKDDVVFLCRPVKLHQPLEKRQMAVDVTADRGRGVWLPARRGHRVSTPLVLSQGGSEVRGEPGEHQFLLELRAGADGHRRFYFIPQPNGARPGAGEAGTRLSRRRNLYAQVRAEFDGVADRWQARWEAQDELWIDNRRNVDDWLPGHADVWLARRYTAAIDRRRADLQKELAEESGVKAMVLAGVKERIQAWLERPSDPAAGEPDVARLRPRYYRLATMQLAIATAARVRSMRLAVDDQQETFKDRYPKGAEFLGRIAALEKKVEAVWGIVLGDGVLGNGSESLAAVLSLDVEVAAAGTEILLANPVLDFDKLLLVKGGSGFASNWGGPNRLGSEIVILSPVRPDGQLTTIHPGSVSSMDLHWDAQRVLFSEGNALWEIGVDGSGLRRVSAEDPPVFHYDACYLPDGKIVCVSNACEQAVPCTGGANVGNLHIMDADGGNERRVTFDQDHDWNPVVMHDGRVVYTRWEYTDTPHYFSRLLFRMNPDGSGQMEFYGSNSYWPNAMYWPQPIPGHPTMVSCIVSGHHGVSRVGELLVLDPARGRQEADGVVQRIPGYGKKVEPIIMDRLVVDVWPKFAAPYPLAEPGTNAGAGKYFLACVQQDRFSPWDLYLVDVFDNMTPILTGGYMTPIPLRPRPKPPVLASHINPRRSDALVYLADIYQGGGLAGYPRGSIKALRVGSHHYRYAGNGDTRASSLEGGWDVKRILGTVPVYEDGSALFRVPANTPIFLQPLDAEGKAQQQMRSWFTAMPGETISCIGCHDKQNSVPPSKYTTSAMGRRPSEIEPWQGPVRGFSFDREVQPLLDRRCTGCHNDRPYQDGDRAIATLDLRAKRLHEGFEGDYSPAYVALQAYVRRAGYESDYHMHVPAEFEPDTSMLVQLLKKGHYNVRLTPDEWQRLYTWIDFNIPYPVNWRESHRPPTDEQVALRAKYKKLYAAIDDRDEDPVPLPPIGTFELPQPAPPRPAATLSLDPWPLGPEEAKSLQAQAGPIEKEVDLGDGVAMKFVVIPAGRFVMGDPAGFDDECRQAVVSIGRPFYLGRFEVTNAQYARFDPGHDSAYVDGRWKDRTTRGTPINAPDQPVVRVSWHRAMAFCRWLSEQTGHRATLPTEAQWEWACRAGTASTFSFGEHAPGMNNLANLCDASVQRWNHDRAEPDYNDGVAFTAPGGRYPANAWGLADMHGNVAEWCSSSYRPYPYRADDGRDDPAAPGMKVVRGGSWADTLRFATSASRWRYEPHKPVYNVGLRVVLELRAEDIVASAAADE